MTRASLISADAQGVDRAVQALRAGALVAFPTETVYGLGADATSDHAIANLYAAKQRPEFNPLIIHVADAAQLDHEVVWTPLARVLAGRFWPGPLTLVLPVQPGCRISLLARAGLATMAVRIPSHPVARALLTAVQLPIAAPSANRSGTLSPTTPLHVLASLGDKIDLILASGRAQIGLESTIVDVTGAQAQILRLGGTSVEDIAACLGAMPEMKSTHDPLHPTSPGQLRSHYAPKLPLRLNVSTARDDEAYVLYGPELGLRGGALRKNLSPSGDLTEAAAQLFLVLHECDGAAVSGIAVAPIPDVGLGRAINDRLQRAAAPRP